MAESVIHTNAEPTWRVRVLLLPGVHALDLAGPVQAIYEANGFGADYQLTYVAAQPDVRSAQGFVIAELEPLPDIDDNDWVLVPGTESTGLDELEVPTEWLRAACQSGARVTSVCSGAFALAKAGLLDGRRCTTHWKVVERLRAWCPTANVLENRLFVLDGNLVTSAGEASGIDMTLALIEHDYGPRIAALVAREMVVYLRRSGESAQRSTYLDYRAHIHPGVHRVQDWIISHPDRRATIDKLAEVAAMSPRHLTRVFRDTTGVTVKVFSHKVKLEVAQNLLHNLALSVEEIAGQCGFQDARQLRRLWKEHFGMTVSEARRRAGVAAARH